MQLKRVAITGMGALSPFGVGVDPLYKGLKNMDNGIQTLPETYELPDLRCHIGGKIPHFRLKDIPRQIRRTMTTMSCYAYTAALEALEQAGVTHELIEQSYGRAGLALASTTGSSELLEDFFRGYLPKKELGHCKSTTFLKIMGHSSAACISQALSLTGRIIAPAAACATSSQAIGLGFEAIALGNQDMMLCGGTEELHPLALASFDFINAMAIHFNDAPEKASRPFDINRDGVICSEGAGLILLEEYEHAQARGAQILGEVVGFSSLSSPYNPVTPDSKVISETIKVALQQAGLDASDIAYINAHATATPTGDIAETEALYKIFKATTPISSYKGHIGHTLAASGSLETIATLCAMKDMSLIATRNLDNVDPACSAIYHVRHGQKPSTPYFIKNNFALGGVATSLVIKESSHDLN